MEKFTKQIFIVLFILVLLPFISKGQKTGELFTRAGQSNSSGWLGDAVKYSAESTSENDTLTVITYNIWNGFDWGQDTIRLKKLQKWMKNQQPSVVALQELCGYTTEKTGKRCQILRS